MQEAMHAARLVAAHSALLALLVEQQGDSVEAMNGITVSYSVDPNLGLTNLDVIYTHNGQPVAGEGM